MTKAASALLGKFEPYIGEQKVLIEDQGTGDIIEGILKTHKKYASQYDNAASLLNGSPVEVAKKIFDILKQNCRYVIEPVSKQTLRSPAAILATGQTLGCDCKSYALFTAGLLDAYRRKTGKDFDIAYRFAGYYGGGLAHVFVVITVNGKEYWIDPVLPTFNDRSKVPTKYKDKKLKNMALMAMAGVPQYTAVGKSIRTFPQASANQVGFVPVAAALAVVGKGKKIADIANKIAPIVNLFRGAALKKEADVQSKVAELESSAPGESGTYADVTAYLKRLQDSKAYSLNLAQSGRTIETRTRQKAYAEAADILIQKWSAIASELQKTGTVQREATTGTGGGLPVLPIALAAGAALFLLKK